MEEKKIIASGNYYFIFYIIFIAGAMGHFADRSFNLMLAMTPWVLLIAAFLALILSGIILKKKILLWLALFYSATFAIEITGVRTGIIFGEYNYGNVLGYKAAGVPVIIGLNWVLLITGAYCISNLLSKNKFVLCFTTGLLLVLFDYMLEPVAIKLGYWSWTNNIIPMQNYFAWFVISMLAAISLIFFNIKICSKALIHYYISMAMFFLILNFK